MPRWAGRRADRWSRWERLCAAFAVWRFGGWGAPDYLWILIGLQLGLVLGWVASRFDAVARRLIGEEALDSRVEGRAAEAFLEEQVFATRDRTGVLIFVALFEHRVLVLADEGIDERVADDAWDEISGELALGLRRGTPAPALIHAVERCADLLGGARRIRRWTVRTSCPTSRGSAVTRARLASPRCCCRRSRSPPWPWTSPSSAAGSTTTRI